MGLKEDIQKKAKEIEKEIFQVESVSFVPTLSNTKLNLDVKDWNLKQLCYILI